MGKDERLLNVTEVAHRLDLHLITVYRWVKSGRIPASRLPSGQIRIAERDLEKLLSAVDPKEG